MDCLFCKVISGDIPVKLIYEDETVVAFNDINPQAPHHILIVPRKHIPTLNAVEVKDNELIGNMLHTAKLLANAHQIDEDGYRLVMNCNAGAGQTVFHIHLHLLGGRQMTWPPG